MMAKVSKHIKFLIACLVVFLCSNGTLLAVDPKDTDGDEGKKEKKELVEEGNELTNTEKTVKSDSDKVKSANKVLIKSKENKAETKVKKTDNSKSSLVSYNFVFYLMYKFKIADIFDLSKEKNSLSVPNQSDYKALGMQIIRKVLDKVNTIDPVKH